MEQAINKITALTELNHLIEDGWERKDIFEYYVEQGYAKSEIFSLFVQAGLMHSSEKIKNDMVNPIAETQQRIPTSNNPLEEALSSLLSMGITYGMPLVVIMFGVGYVWSEMARDLDVGIRSAAAAIMPLAITLAFAKSDMRANATNFLSDNKWIAFGSAFTLAMCATAAAMWMRDFNNVIPVGELAFSTTLSLMIFGNKRDGDVSFIHVGAVSGLLTYVVLFGVGL